MDAIDRRVEKWKMTDINERLGKVGGIRGNDTTTANAEIGWIGKSKIRQSVISKKRGRFKWVTEFVVWKDHLLRIEEVGEFKLSVYGRSGDERCEQLHQFIELLGVQGLCGRLVGAEVVNDSAIVGDDDLRFVVSKWVTSGGTKKWQQINRDTWWPMLGGCCNLSNVWTIVRGHIVFARMDWEIAGDEIERVCFAGEIKKKLGTLKSEKRRAPPPL
jgi:hypothetical protein